MHYEAGIHISMTESGDPKDNAVAERLNNTIKNELFKDTKFHSIEEVKRAMAKVVEFVSVSAMLVYTRQKKYRSSFYS